MDDYKVMVRSLDGIEDWVPVSANRLNNDHYEILEDPKYNDLYDGLLFEFYPGDIVQVDSNILPSADYEQAHQLIKLSSQADRKYYEFMFLATLRHIQHNSDTKEKYWNEIMRIKREKKEGKFFYRAILELIEYLDRRFPDADAEG